MKRLLDCNYSDIVKFTKKEKLESIRLSEGRIIVCETSVVNEMSVLGNVSDMEIAAAFGADMILLNIFDIENPKIPAIDVTENKVISELKHLTGRLVGVNLEPVELDLEQKYVLNTTIPKGRTANLQVVGEAIEMGVDYIVLTGNPNTGVTNEKIINAINKISSKYAEKIIIIAGKMHAAGSAKEAGEKIISKEEIEMFIDSGADVILLPAPGTVPGITFEFIHEMIVFIHSKNKLAMTAIGTSQEGADETTIKKIALMCKMAGADLHHIGDAGFGGLDPMNIMNYGITIRGKRHTFMRMARSINR